MSSSAQTKLPGFVFPQIPHLDWIKIWCTISGIRRCSALWNFFFFFKVGCLIKKIKQNLALIVQKYFYRELHETHEICHGTNTVLRLTIQYCNSPNAIEFYCVMTYYATLFNYIAALSFNWSIDWLIDGLKLLCNNFQK